MKKFIKALLITFIILLIATIISILINIIKHYCPLVLALIFIILIFAIFYVVCQELDFYKEGENK